MASYQQAYSVFKQIVNNILALEGVKLVRVACREAYPQPNDCYILVQVLEPYAQNVRNKLPTSVEGVPIVVQAIPSPPRTA
jgi:hypothetical protein